MLRIPALHPGRDRPTHHGVRTRSAYARGGHGSTRLTATMAPVWFLYSRCRSWAHRPRLLGRARGLFAPKRIPSTSSATIHCLCVSSLGTNVTLDRIAGRGITHLGGSILGNSSRGDPFKLPRPPQ